MRYMVLFCLFVAALPGPQHEQLKPDAFPGLPAAIRADLVGRGCAIPQPYSARSPEGVVRGRFTKADQMDTAVLCSAKGQSTILVYRNDKVGDVVSLAARPDPDFMQGIGPGAIGYSRAIGVASPAYIKEHHQAYGGPTPPPLDHDGINDIFVEKGSEVLYWYGGRWLKLQGADAPAEP